MKIPQLNEGDVQLTKRQYVNTTAAAITSAITDNTTTNLTTSSYIPTTSAASTPTIAATSTPITTMSKSMKVKFSKNIEGEVELNHNTPSACNLSKICF